MGTSRRKAGPLGAEVEGYRAWLIRHGYTPQTVRNMLQYLGQLGRWLGARGLGVYDLDEQRMAVFLADRQTAGKPRVLGPRAMEPLLAYLREMGAAPPAPLSVTPLDVLLGQYRSWMVRERGLATSTVLRYENTARRFLREQAVRDGALRAGGVDRGGRQRVPAPGVRPGLGRIGQGPGGRAPLGLEVPVFAGHHPAAAWDGRSSGRRVASGRVAAAADVGGGGPASARQPATAAPPSGVRDFAIMMLVARLGLRSIEVARLRTVATWTGGPVNSSCAARDAGRTGSRCWPRSVRRWSPTCPAAATPQRARHLFLTCRAPRGPIRADLVGDVVERACLRAGLPHVGPHRLRHALAGELLRQGAGLVAISQVLRHQDLATTALYAKVDLVALRPGRAALAGSGSVSALEQALDRLPGAASFARTRPGRGRLAAAGLRGLPRRTRGLSTVTIEATLAWAQHSPTGAA